MDRMRVVGPSTSVPPQLGEGGAEAAAASGTTASRQDGRADDELRKIFAKPGVVGNAAGSAYMEVGGTKVIAACYGPRDMLRTREYSAQGKLSCELKFAPFATKQRGSHIQTDLEHELSMSVAQAIAYSVRLEAYPKSLIDLYITVLEDDGSALAAAISCASLAVANAEIEMIDLVAGCTLGLEGKRLVLDPVAEEAANQTTTLTVAYLPSMDEVSGVVQSGEMPFELQGQAIQACVTGCGQINEVQQVCIRQAAAAAVSAGN